MRYPGEDQRLEGPDGLGKCGRRELRFLQCQPLARDRLEGVSLSSLLGLPLGARINAGGKLSPRLLPPVTCESIDVKIHAMTRMEILRLEIQGFSGRSRRQWKLSDFAGSVSVVRKEDSKP